MAKRRERKGGADFLGALPSPPSREEARGGGDDSARILRGRGRANREAGRDQEHVLRRFDMEGLIRRSLEGVNHLIQAASSDDFRVILPQPDDRLLEVFLEARQTTEGGGFLSIFSTCGACGQGRLEFALRLNNRLPRGRLAVRTSGGGPTLTLTRLITHDEISTSSVRSAVLEIAGWGDRIERALDNARGFDYEELEHFFDQYITDIIINHEESLKRLSDSPELTPQPTETTPADEQSRHLDALLGTVPAGEGYEEQAARREALKYAFDRKFAESHGEAIKAEMLRRGSTAGTYEDKLELVRWSNGELRRFGLAVSTPKTGVGVLAAAEGGRGGVGRFQLKAKIKDEDDRFPIFTATDAAELVENISIVVAPPRRESLAERVEREAETSARNRRLQ